MSTQKSPDMTPEAGAGMHLRKMSKSRIFQMCGIMLSIFMILLIIFYWDDVGTAHFYLHTAFTKIQSTHLPTSVSVAHEHAKGTEKKMLSSETATSFINLELTHGETGHQGEGASVVEGENVDSKPVANSKEHLQDVDWGTNTEEPNIKLEQLKRKQTIRDLCADSSFTFSGKNRAFEDIPNKELDHLIVDDRHGIIYCYVPKVACTNWKRIMILLSESLVNQGTPYHDPLEIPRDLVHNSSSHVTFNKFWKRYGKFSKHLMKVKLKKYTKFLFVRDPFVRLISAFRSKFEIQNEDFYKRFAIPMLQLYANCSQPPPSVSKAFSAGIKPTFSNFIQYLLDLRTEMIMPFNEHWRQVYRLCHPCQINYDFIGKLESLEQDAKYLLSLLNVEKLVQFPPSFRNRTVSSWERNWFSEIPKIWRRKLFELYKPDFALFGYPKPTNLLLD
ncbi:carbohydrate sulfotransferase 12 [Callorhinchus milii]|uniref:Carbohydrate sulfotransferase n=2 Tax=Callorhinchus milii TaxID=7868 RepID=A0A4W3JFX8_CALMI|nr:carbohydrate sulfotransferase 12 [Callorhinchus milii]XP_007904254.1 carbohydrate sulfotransferase 12 [Callorhinchus milii]|eukprot:gi/632975479/ref/XP_007904253.1/ PREDICTED: carbohydrate sulfotransferase 12 [Callorhinchus milii]